MSEGPRPRQADGGGGFASGLATHFGTFRSSRDTAAVIVVEVTLANGVALLFEGLHVEQLSDVPGCVMIRGSDPSSGPGLVVREDHIVHVEFDIKPVETRRFGFGRD